MGEEKQSETAPVTDEKPRTSLFIVVTAWDLWLMGTGAILYAIFCPECGYSITKRILIGLSGVGIFYLGIGLRKTKKWALYTFFILVSIVTLYLIFKFWVLFY